MFAHLLEVMTHCKNMNALLKPVQLERFRSPVARSVHQQQNAAEIMIATACGMVPPSQCLDEDVKELCGHYDFEDRIITQLLNDILWGNHEMCRVH